MESEPLLRAACKKNNQWDWTSSVQVKDFNWEFYEKVSSGWAKGSALSHCLSLYIHVDDVKVSLLYCSYLQSKGWEQEFMFTQLK